MRGLLVVVTVLVGAFGAHAHALNVVKTAPAKAEPAGAVAASDRCEPAPRAAIVRVMLLDRKTAEWLKDTAKGLGQVVAAEAGKVSGYSILSAEEVRAALDQEAGKAMLGCDENSCLAELAQALDADLVVAGRIDDTSDGNSLISLTLLNARAIVVVNRVNMVWPGDAKHLPDVVRTAAQTLMLEPKQRPPGSLKLLGLASDAHIYVDGVDHGANHEIEGLAIGPHEVKVEAPDKITAVEHAVVNAGAQTAMAITLEDQPVPGVWLWLGGTGAVLVGGATVLAVAYALGQSDVVVQATVPTVGPNDVETLGSKR